MGPLDLCYIFFNKLEIVKKNHLLGLLVWPSFMERVGSEKKLLQGRK